MLGSVNRAEKKKKKRGGTDVEYRGSCTVLRREKLYIGSCIVQVCQLCFRRRDCCDSSVRTEIIMPCPLTVAPYDVFTPSFILEVEV